MKQLNGRMSMLALLGISLILSASAARAQEPNSPKDPYMMKAIDRPSAQTPAPWGIDAGGRVGTGPLNYFGDIFYDCWSIGYHATDYGKGVRLGLRGMGRDQAEGSFIEYGSNTATSESDTAKYDYVGVGIGKIAGYNGKGVTTALGILAHAGTAISGGSAFYVGLDLSYGVRIPITSMALTLEAVVSGTLISAGGSPTSVEINSRTGSDSKNVSVVGGIGLNFKYAFNFNAN